jgi:hypothetical protein
MSELNVHAASSMERAAAKIAAAIFWRWYEAHQEDVIYRLLWRTLKVKDLKWLFDRIFGRYDA